MYLHIFFLMAVNVLCKLRVLEGMSSRDEQQNGRKNWNIHLLGESETELLVDDCVKAHHFIRVKS